MTPGGIGKLPETLAITVQYMICDNDTHRILVAPSLKQGLLRIFPQRCLAK